MKIKTDPFFVLALLGAIMWLGVTACSHTTLAPGGVYSSMANGTNIFEADLSITTAYTELDSFVSWESANHPWLASNYPPVVAQANNIRANAPKWRDTAVSLRNAYAASSTVANSNAMATAIAVMSAAVNNSTNYMSLTPK